MFSSNKPGVPPGINLLQKPSQKLSRPSGNLANPVIFSRKPGKDNDSTGSVTEGCSERCRTNSSLMAMVCGPKMFNPPSCVARRRPMTMICVLMTKFPSSEARRRQIMTIVCCQIYNSMTTVCCQITNFSSCVVPQPMYHVIPCIYNMLERTFNL